MLVENSEVDSPGTSNTMKFVWNKPSTHEKENGK